MTPRPVVFSGGLYGLMPGWLYSELLGLLADGGRRRVVLPPRPCRAADVERIARTLGQTVDFVSHSSFDYGVLDTPWVRRAVLLDPAAIPPSLAFDDRVVHARMPVRVLAARRAVEGPAPFLLRGFRVQVRGPAVASRSFDGAGHADVLDDAWADWGAAVGIASAGAHARGPYRRAVAADAVAFLASPRLPTARRRPREQ
jgi:hypothetical protein